MVSAVHRANHPQLTIPFQVGRYSFISERVLDFNLQKNLGAAWTDNKAPTSVSGCDTDMSFNSCGTFIFNTYISHHSSSEDDSMQIIFTRAFHADVMVPTNYTYMCCVGAAHGIMNEARALVSTLNHIFGKAGRCWKLRWL